MPQLTDTQFATGAGLDEIIITQELASRAAGPVDIEAENAALLSLMRGLSSEPKAVMQRLVECAMSLTGAGSAGVSLESFEGTEPVFRWVATAGLFDAFRGGTVRREASPCDEVLRRCEPLLMRHPERHYVSARYEGMPLHEVLLAPFWIDGRPVGTVWAASHSDAKSFDATNLRTLKTLAVFASVAVDAAGLVAELRDRHSNAQREFAESERIRTLLSQWFDRAPGAVALLRGRDHIFELANEACQQLVGNRPLIGMRVADAVPEIVEQGITAILDQVFATGVPYVARQHRLLLTHGPLQSTHERFLDFVFEPVREPDARVSGIFMQAQDVTEQRQALEALRQADARKDEFLALVSHELRNPLAPILTSVQVLERMSSSADARQSHVLRTLRTNTTALANLVDDLLDLARVRAGRLRLDRSRLVLQDVVQRAVGVVKPAIERNAHDIELDLPVYPIRVEGDAHRLTQVFSQLLDNAVKFTPRGGTIKVQMQLAGQGVRVVVSDSGIGIEHELMPRIFDLFEKAPQGNRPAMRGMGVGLALVRELVELHGGTIEVASLGAGHGSAFTVRLPKRPAATP